ncbi:unnamed protein product [Chrysoparadoxa australica]
MVSQAPAVFPSSSKPFGPLYVIWRLTLLIIHFLLAPLGCAICLDLVYDPLATNCGHIYCSKCILDYWEGCHRKAISCPTCRAGLVSLTRCQQDSEKREKSLELDPVLADFNKSKGAAWRASLYCRRTLCTIVSDLRQGNLNSLTTFLRSLLYAYAQLQVVILVMFVVSPFAGLSSLLLGLLSHLGDAAAVLFVLIYATCIVKGLHRIWTRVEASQTGASAVAFLH